MSARQPFVPGNGFAPSSRPESRAAHANAAPLTTPLHFVADASNPLHGGSTTNQTNADNAPLNIGSLTKSTRTQNPPPRRQSVQTPRPATADPRSSSATNRTSDAHSKPKAVPNHRLQAHAHAKHIVAPTPLQARAAPSLFSNAPPAFKTPALPDAHGFRTPTNDPARSPENDAPENENANASFRLKTLPSQPGPHRHAFGARAIMDLSGDDEVFEVPEGARNKRARSEVDDDEGDEHAYAAPAASKRFKAQVHVENDENAYRRSSADEHELNEMYHRSSSPADSNPAAHRFAPQPQYADPQPQPHPQHQDSSSDLASLAHVLKAEHLLGDLELDALGDKYARAAEKWRACSREEWAAGAEDLTALYTKIFDFAKEHMTEKLALFTNCDARLATQRGVLAERDGLLGAVKEGLVAESARVLGGARVVDE
ncbi:hypothetical protein B0H17DRAFT_1195865 [Mycena rosella]|uniref:Extracellular mutant protein 11 C-terminal domain-containing protein n=1 Tax=Mycena rosella TaxID=1033263 RepID=A0AAD7DV59_MYCRO|nr:hypothetical protein B0H17DRAFT_1195865 [Mycena rosella]